jgi:hypothetical protein
MKNLEHQIKSQWYYIFWGAMAVAVVGGQIYVGLGYRKMAEATNSSFISVTCVPPYQPPSSYAMGKNRTGEFE